MKRYSFSGHETFYCRNYWIKKGLDHIWSGNKFDNQAVIELGVGKNMVNSIRFWLKAFGTIDSNGEPTVLAKTIFGKNGYDPYCEDIATIYLLHFMLVTTEHSSIYSLVFNQFRRQRIEFTKEQIQTFIEKSCALENVTFNSNSIKKDINVFLSNYSFDESAMIEDSVSALLRELEYVNKIEKSGKEKWFTIENKERLELPADIILYSILENKSFGNIISFNELLNKENSPGSVFALNSNGLMNKIDQLVKKYKRQLVFTDDGGIRVLQIKKNINPIDILKEYYGK